MESIRSQVVLEMGASAISRTYWYGRNIDCISYGDGKVAHCFMVNR